MKKGKGEGIRFEVRKSEQEDTQQLKPLLATAPHTFTTHENLDAALLMYVIYFRYISYRIQREECLVINRYSERKQ